MLWTIKTSWAMFAGREGMSMSGEYEPRSNNSLVMPKAFVMSGSEIATSWFLRASAGRRLAERRAVKVYLGWNHQGAGWAVGVNLEGIGGEGCGTDRGEFAGATAERKDLINTSMMKGTSWKPARVGTEVING